MATQQHMDVYPGFSGGGGDAYGLEGGWGGGGFDGYGLGADPVARFPGVTFQQSDNVTVFSAPVLPLMVAVGAAFLGSKINAATAVALGLLGYFGARIGLAAVSKSAPL